MQRLVSVLLAVVVLGTTGRARAADGVFDLSWNTCSPIVQNLSTNVPDKYSIYASVTGFDVPQKGYDVVFMYSNAAQGIPDAWRFDPYGCPGSPFVKIDHLAPLAIAATCPSFQGAVSSLQIKDVNFVSPSDPSGFPRWNIRVSLYNAYPPGIAVMDPGVRYFLGRFEFEHTYSVPGAGTVGLSCGGFEQSMCFKLAQAEYQDLSGVTRNFGRHPGATYISFNGPEGCVGPTPTRSTTWGTLKNQYR